MNSSYLVVLFNILCGLFVLLLLIAEKRQWRPGIWLFKTAASNSFVAAGLSHSGNSPYGPWPLCALILCLLGDVLLIPKEKKYFMMGVGAFLLGHVAFIGAFMAGFSSFNLRWVLVALVILVLFIFFIMKWPWKEVPKEFFIPVNIYIVVISSMVALAAGGVGGGASWTILLAAVMFFISDISVARHQFITHEFSNKLWGLPLYYGAVLLFVASFAA